MEESRIRRENRNLTMFGLYYSVFTESRSFSINCNLVSIHYSGPSAVIVKVLVTEPCLKIHSTKAQLRA